ncbi:MAG TPA: hypothetical protein VES20_03790 [Bryobacteraceae bacterium]|nr:hypothetical protein [Bryobacteraceae bacterium]
MSATPERTTVKVKLFGVRGSPAAYTLRDFLQRSVVAFDWVELTTDEEARAAGVQPYRTRASLYASFRMGPGLTLPPCASSRTDLDG